MKVQDGCDYKCTYCTIPLARGISRSDTLDNILIQAKKIAASGIKEVVLTGVNIGDYGKGEFGNKKHGNTFLELIMALDNIRGIERIRISSIEPNLLTDDIIKFVAESNLYVPHFHIPLQSGCDYILKKMKRRYLSDHYIDRINRIKKIMPFACIGSDVITGFPGETNERFIETYNFLLKNNINYFHVFTYSERSHTDSINFDGKVSQKIKIERSKFLRVLSEKKRRAFYEQNIGKKAKVLFENGIKKGYIQGFSENYIKVRKPWNPNAVNIIETGILDDIDEDGFMRISKDL